MMIDWLKITIIMIALNNRLEKSITKELTDRNYIHDDY